MQLLFVCNKSTTTTSQEKKMNEKTFAKESIMIFLYFKVSALVMLDTAASPHFLSPTIANKKSYHFSWNDVHSDVNRIEKKIFHLWVLKQVLNAMWVLLHNGRTKATLFTTVCSHINRIFMHFQCILKKSLFLVCVSHIQSIITSSSPMLFIQFL